MAYYFKINVYLPRLQNNVAHGVPGRDGKDYSKHVRSTVWVQTIFTTKKKKDSNGTNTQTDAGLYESWGAEWMRARWSITTVWLYGAKMDAYRNG